MTLIQLFEKYNTDKKMDNGKPAVNGLTGHNYAAIYDSYLGNRKIDKMLEIGISTGASMKAWREYFPNSEIHGLDITEKNFNRRELEGKGIVVHIGNQGDADYLKREFGGIDFDLIIDDGSHRMRDQQISFIALYLKLKKGGIYVIEDLHTSRIGKYQDKGYKPTLDIMKKMQAEIHYLNPYIIGFIRK